MMARKNHKAKDSEILENVDTIEERERVAHATPDFPIVGIGASAGGLAAFEAFFSGMPADTAPGMAFVLVQHLDPNHKSILSDLIKRYTRMEVYEVEDGMMVCLIVPTLFRRAATWPSWVAPSIC